MKSTTHTKIVKTASRLFLTQGYNNTGINRIIEESGIVKSTLYQHFNTKDDLAVEYLKNNHDLWVSNFDEINKIASSDCNCIELIFDFLEKWAIDREFKGCVFINIFSEVLSSNQKIIDEVVNHKNWLKQFLLNRFQKINEATVCAILMLIEGAIVQSQIHKKVWPIRASREAALQLLDKY